MLSGSFRKLQAEKEAKDSPKSRATCELVLPLNDLQQLIWSVGRGTEDG
jgi:hypothetical protein